MIKILGIHVEESNGKEYEVLKRFNYTQNNPLASRSEALLDTIDYITRCGIDLNMIGENEESFEMITIDGIIHRDKKQ